jgi:hypothetical protein
MPWRLFSLQSDQRWGFRAPEKEYHAQELKFNVASFWLLPDFIRFSKDAVNMYQLLLEPVIRWEWAW